jgi:hypothetical protein
MEDWNCMISKISGASAAQEGPFQLSTCLATAMTSFIAERNEIGERGISLNTIQICASIST